MDSHENLAEDSHHRESRGEAIEKTIIAATIESQRQLDAGSWFST